MKMKYLSALFIAMIFALTSVYAQENGSYYYRESKQAGPTTYDNSSSSGEVRKQGMRTRPHTIDSYNLPTTGLRPVQMCRLQILRAGADPTQFSLHSYIFATYEPDMEEWVYQTEAFACEDTAQENSLRARLEHAGYSSFFKVTLTGYYTWR